MTTISAPITGSDIVTEPVTLQMYELVLKTGRFDELREWYRLVLNTAPFLEREPDVVAKPVAGQERAADVRLAFFKIHDAEYPFGQLLAIFGINGLPSEPVTGPGLHHFQFRFPTVEAMVQQFERLSEHGVTPHRTANHGAGTSFYYRDPDSNVIELSFANFTTREEEAALIASEAFRKDPSGREWDGAEFVARYRSGESLDQLLSLEM